MAISVVVCVGDQVADALIAKLVPQIKALKIGAGTSCGLDMGPLVTGQARDKVSGYVDDGVAAGAELVVDGRGLSIKGHEEGFFLGGCLFDRVTPEMRIYKEEIFGPVLCIVRIKSLEEAMQLINDHEYGNGTARPHAAQLPAVQPAKQPEPVDLRQEWPATPWRCWRCASRYLRQPCAAPIT